MNKTFLITYDLLKKCGNYDALYAQIKALGNWWHHLDSVWIVTTAMPFKEVSDLVRAQLDDQDSLLIVDITGMNRRGWLTQRAWDWLNAHNPVRGENTSCGHCPPA